MKRDDEDVLAMELAMEFRHGNFDQMHKMTAAPDRGFPGNCQSLSTSSFSINHPLSTATAHTVFRLVFTSRLTQFSRFLCPALCL